MTFEELRKAVEGLPLKEKRFDREGLLEVVLKKAQLDRAQDFFVRFFGPPAKPPGKVLAREVAEYMESFGGVRHNQTLFLVEKNGFLYYAMIWPWADGVSFTVKLEQSKLKLP